MRIRLLLNTLRHPRLALRLRTVNDLRDYAAEQRYDAGLCVEAAAFGHSGPSANTYIELAEWAEARAGMLEAGKNKKH